MQHSLSQTGRPSFRYLLNMNLGFWGLQVGNGLQIADVSAIFESLGADASQLPLLWLGAPVTGLLVQPLVGYMSDRTWTRWGRRQPYFLAGAVLGAVMLLLLPQTTYLWQAALVYTGLQLALNVGLAPVRSLVGDLLQPAQRTLGYAIQGFCVGLGTITASALPWALDKVGIGETASTTGVPASITVSYSVGAAIFLLSSFWTFWTVPESPPEPSLAKTPIVPKPSFQGLRTAIAKSPPIMRQLAGVQVLTWAGVYCLFIYLPTAIAIDILNAPNRHSPEYIHGVEWAGICIAFYNLICLIASLLIPFLSRRIGRPVTHAGCLTCGALGLIGLLFIHDQYTLLLPMVGIGIAWAGILSIPYALLMDELSAAESGLYMGLFNSFVTLPQLVLSIGFGWVMTSLLQGDRLWALALGGIFLGLAALGMLRVSESSTRSEETETVGDERPVMAQN